MRSAPQLYPYQSAVVSAFHAEVAAGRKRILLVAPTGSGKTVIGAEIIRVSKPVLVLAHTREIISQTSQNACGLAHGIIQAGTASRPFEEVQVASIQTLSARAVRTTRWSCR